MNRTQRQNLLEEMIQERVTELEIQLDPKNPLTLYYIDQLDTIELIELWHEENEDEELFDFWTNSDYGKEFFEVFDQDKNIQEASTNCLNLLKTQTQNFYQVHFEGKVAPTNYRPQHDIGDNLFKIEIDEKLDLYSYNKEDAKNQKERILRALEIIKKYTPESYELFREFTHTIVAHNEENIVSYSSQNLPGYSTINLYHRDFVDLMDDLLHENGHHHLNLYLNTEELIIEDDDCIYHSPWREALRPIRGIYHAYFTFFWALKLFADLEKSLDELPLNDDEKAKISARRKEEYKMLTSCEADLKSAYKEGKITEAGWKVISEIRKEIEKRAPIEDNG